MNDGDIWTRMNSNRKAHIIKYLKDDLKKTNGEEMHKINILAREHPQKAKKIFISMMKSKFKAHDYDQEFEFLDLIIEYSLRVMSPFELFSKWYNRLFKSSITRGKGKRLTERQIKDLEKKVEGGKVEKDTFVSFYK